MLVSVASGSCVASGSSLVGRGVLVGSGVSVGGNSVGVADGRFTTANDAEVGVGSGVTLPQAARNRTVTARKSGQYFEGFKNKKEDIS